ncbi:hypothetical protein D3C81_1381860 [compost metagenome]
MPAHKPFVLVLFGHISSADQMWYMKGVIPASGIAVWHTGRLSRESILFLFLFLD